jgi:uncharacterized membrane protein YesL
MTPLLVTGRGLRDFYDHLFRYFIVSALWWVATITVVFGPPFTAALFATADPRRHRIDDQLSPRDCIRFMREKFFQSWGLALISVLPCCLLAFNIWYYADSDGLSGNLSLVWLGLFLVGVIATLGAFSGLSLFGDSAINALRAGLGLIPRRLGQTMILALLLIVLTTVSFFLIIPAIFMLPAVIASIVNRYALEVWKVDVTDEHEPTDARMEEAEKRRGWRRRIGG